VREYERRDTARVPHWVPAGETFAPRAGGGGGGNRGIAESCSVVKPINLILSYSGLGVFLILSSLLEEFSGSL
jgi:hypothetical protein